MIRRTRSSARSGRAIHTWSMPPARTSSQMRSLAPRTGAPSTVCPASPALSS